MTADDLPKSAKRRSTVSRSPQKNRNARKGMSQTMRSQFSKVAQFRAKSPPMLIFEAAEMQRLYPRLDLKVLILRLLN